MLDEKRLKAHLTMITSHEPGLWFTYHKNIREAVKPLYLCRGDIGYIVCVVDSSYCHVPERAGFYADTIADIISESGLKFRFKFDGIRREGIDVFPRAGQKIGFIIIIGYSDKSVASVARLFGKKTRALSLCHSESDRKSLESEVSGQGDWIIRGLEEAAQSLGCGNKNRISFGDFIIDGDEAGCNVYLPSHQPSFKDAVSSGIAMSRFAKSAKGDYVWETEPIRFYKDLSRQ